MLECLSTTGDFWSRVMTDDRVSLAFWSSLPEDALYWNTLHLVSPLRTSAVGDTQTHKLMLWVTETPFWKSFNFWQELELHSSQHCPTQWTMPLAITTITGPTAVHRHTHKQKTLVCVWEFPATHRASCFYHILAVFYLGMWKHWAQSQWNV